MSASDDTPQNQVPAPQPAGRTLPGETVNDADMVVHTPPQKKSAYRRWFATLNPSIQLVLSQLWMPVFMCIMFTLCYVGSFQHVAPRHVPVGIVSDTTATQTLQAAVKQNAPGSMDFTTISDHAEAREQVRTGKLAMAYDPEKNQLVVATAHQAQAASIIPKLIDPLLPALGQKEAPTTDDVAPLGAHDIGMTPMYLMLTWCISGYLAAMFIGLMGGPLSRRTRYGIILGVSAFLSLLSSTLVDLVLGAITGHFWALLGLGFAWSVAIGVAVNGLSYFLGRFIAAPAMTLFIFLSIPSSGAAMPAWMMPEFFQWMQNIVVGSGISEMLKHLVYGVGPGYLRGWIMLGGYLLVGVLLTWVGKPYWEWKRVRRILKGKTTMFHDAQRASGRKNTREENEILATHGLKVRESDGALIRIPALHGAELREMSRTEREHNRQLRLAEVAGTTQLPPSKRPDLIDNYDRYVPTGVMDSLEPADIERYNEAQAAVEPPHGAGRHRAPAADDPRPADQAPDAEAPDAADQGHTSSGTADRD
ncbi:MAG: ABC transporter permease [Galactobacter sp.]